MSSNVTPMAMDLEQPGEKANPKWMKPKGEQKKVPAAVRRQRINMRLRKLVAPKSPVMILNEMLGPITYQFAGPEEARAMTPMGSPGIMQFASCTINGQNFGGSGPSKQIAKNGAAEFAIQALFIDKCKNLPPPVSKKEKKEGGKDADAEGDADMTEPADELPWAQMASMALYKLFYDWQSRGVELPANLTKGPDMTAKADTGNNPWKTQQQMGGNVGGVDFTARGQQPNMRQPGQPKQPKAPKQPGEKKMQKPAKKAPENPTSKHPVQLMNELRGAVIFDESIMGQIPNQTFTLATTIDGKLFQGHGKSKKDAKKNVALKILKDLHQIDYPASM